MDRRGGGAPHFFLLDEKSMKKLLNWKNLRDMWLNISSATYDTKIETRGRVEHIKHCMSSGEIRPPPFDPQYIVCVCTWKNHNNNNNTHFVNTTRIPTCINTTITTAVFDIYWWNLAVKLSEWCWWRPYIFFTPAMCGWLAVIVRC